MLGLIPLARATFDVPFAEENLAGMLALLDRLGVQTAGPRTLLMDGAATDAAVADLKAAGVQDILVLQVTFTDAAAIARIGAEFDGALAIWAPPEPRLGGRLRLNAFCGMNLAAHALGLRERPFSWAYANPVAPETEQEIKDLLAGHRLAKPPALAAPAAPSLKAEAIVQSLGTRRIGRIGEHPEGFDTCAYDPATLTGLTGVKVEAMPLDALFENARSQTPENARSLRQQADTFLTGLEDVDQSELDRSLRLKLALDDIKSTGKYDAFALRCWPETFTEYGGAVCGPASMLGEARTPCACEADVYGAVSQLLLQDVAQAPVFLVDLVDMDVSDDTGVVWHCGQAPISMAARKPSATIHTNRKMPLLFEFPLKEGRVTLARISQARGRQQMVIGGGEMLARPMAFTGTSGTLRFDAPAADVTAKVIGAGLEHHMAIAYGDHRETLREVAGALKLDITEL